MNPLILAPAALAATLALAVSTTPTGKPDKPDLPPRPPAVTWVLGESTEVGCDLLAVTVTQSQTFDHVWDEAAAEWVLADEPTSAASSSFTRPVTLDEARDLDPTFKHRCEPLDDLPDWPDEPEWDVDPAPDPDVPGGFPAPEPEPVVTDDPAADHEREFRAANPGAVYSPVENG